MSQVSFNRTTKALKQCQYGSDAVERYAFNRTTKALKHLSSSAHASAP